MRLLLINPPVYDFACYDYWLKPLGLLYIAGYLKENNYNIDLFDFMDRHSKFLEFKLKEKKYSTGNYHKIHIEKPNILKDFYRPFFRYGIEEEKFIQYIKNNKFDYAFITSMMTYWYMGIDEVIKNIKKYSPYTKIIIGGVYAKLLPDHAKSLDPDFLYTGDLKELKEFLSNKTKIKIQKDLDYEDILPMYELYKENYSAAILTQIGCPYRCLYCAIGRLHPNMKFFNHDYIIKQLDYLQNLGIKDIAFYDDALLYKKEEHFKKLFKKIAKKNYTMRFHFSNGLHVRFIDQEIINIMKRINTGRIALSIETVSADLQKQTGNKLIIEQADKAIDLFLHNGFSPENIYGYIISGLPDEKYDDVINTIEYLHKKGIRILMNEFSPVPLTPYYEQYKEQLKDPILTGKSVFSAKFIYSIEKIQYLKNLIKKYNREIRHEQ